MNEKGCLHLPVQEGRRKQNEQQSPCRSLGQLGMLTGETMDMDTNQDWRDSLARDALAMQV